MLILYSIFAILATFIGAQIQLSEFSLLTGRINYRAQWPQAVTLVATVLAFIIIACDIVEIRFNTYVIVEVMLGLIICVFSEWLLSRLSPTALWVSLVWRVVLCIAMAVAIGLQTGETYPLLPFLAMGLYMRNSPFGIVHSKSFFIACGMVREANHRCMETAANGIDSIKEPTQEAFPRINVAECGILPDTGLDVLHDVQALIDKIGKQGGGTLFFPRGRYLFNMGGKKEFLQINHSHITIEGECDDRGQLLTEFINCGTTVCGERNPWISPFFITTGEALQPSNQFWGLDFLNPKGIHLESGSLSDPGGDGKILTPPFATKVTANATAGSTQLQVEDSSKVNKYILLGMYNTPDGKLIKELLGMDELRPEWITARRAGEEKAPSLQWLVEVKQVIDAHTIELVRPLLYNCPLEYEPAIFNADMLEDIHIRHLRIGSRWNGLFHHHGMPLYYTVGQAQEMDYGWNAINMKRTAHSTVEDVEIRNFTNPIYIQDSREVTVQHVDVSGYDGHQALKVYCHTCDCTFHDIILRSHFADMMGGEGNAYANTFSHIQYLNPTFHPVDYDFHGFSEGPFSPPAFNVFERVERFRYIKGAGAVFMQPACAAGNIWRQCVGEGERKGTLLFHAMTYRVKSGLIKYVTAVGYTIVMMKKKRSRSLMLAKDVFVEKLRNIDSMGIPRSQHAQFFPNSHIEQMQTTAVTS